MKKLSIVSVLIVAIILFSAFSYQVLDTHKKKKFYLGDAVKKGILDIQLTGNGGYTGNCIILKVKNLTTKDTTITVEPGRRLVSEDSTIQDILLIKDIEFRILANSEQEIDLFGFCCQAHNGSPYTKAKYSLGFMEDSAFIKLANFLNKNSLPESVMQSSVWVLSDKNPINSVHNDNKKDKPLMKKLYSFLAAARGIKYEFPWYTLDYKPIADAVFSGLPSTLYADFYYYLPNRCSVDVVIKDEHNKVYEVIYSDRPHNSGNYPFNLNLDVSKYPKGKYYLRLYADNQLKIIKMFEL